MTLKKGVCFLLCMLPFFSSAGVAINLKQAEVLALQKAPELEQLQANKNALIQEAIADDQWVDPKLILGAINVPTDRFSFTQENMTQIQVGLMQQFPKGNSLGIRSLQDRLQASATES